MEDREIIKALEWWLTVANNTGSITLSKEDIFAINDLINRQKAEIDKCHKQLDEFKFLASRVNSIKNTSKDTFTGALLTIAEGVGFQEAVKEFAESFLKKVHDNHYLLSDRNNSKDYGMFTVGIEQAVNEAKEETVGEG